MSALAELLERVRTATGPDQKLSREIYGWVCEHVLKWKTKRIGPDAFGQNDSEILVPPDMPAGFTYPPRGAVSRLYHVPTADVTASIDAAVALVERVLPGAGVLLDIEPKGRCWPSAYLQQSDEQWTYHGWDREEAKTPPLAILAALLSALIARETAP